MPSVPPVREKRTLPWRFAIVALRNKQVERIVLTRPAVEAGEKLGFLPGDLNQKVDPYLRPLYDALFDMMGGDSYQRLQERGGTGDCTIGLYARQNAVRQLYYFGRGTKHHPRANEDVFNAYGRGLAYRSHRRRYANRSAPNGKQSGLLQAMSVLKDIPQIGMVRLTNSDVVRHDMVQTIVKAYEKHEEALLRRNANHGA